MKDYRADIDGLRGIAVLAVIAFHIDESLLPGGFAGVDIFFVISGFLISRNILTEISEERFSLLDFYRRRVKRIAPALLVVIAATLVFAQFWLLPEDAERAADSALWSLFSLSNFYFWLNLDSSYFAEASNELPLLHLWSLAVEEQFYLIWPLLLLLLYRAGRTSNLMILMIIMALASFLYAEVAFHQDPAFAYYMLPTRAGELLLGALVAVAVMRGAERVVPAAAMAPLSWLGAALLVSSLVLLSESLVFPGLYAIPPALGAALVILAGQYHSGGCARLLAFKPLVWVGLISYSAYLWNWPLLAFLRYGYGEISTVMGVAVFVATLSLAWLTYRFVEQPARHSKAPAAKIIFSQYLVPASLLACISLGAMYFDGYGNRFFSDVYRAELRDLRAIKARSYRFSYVCQEKRLSEADLKKDDCVLGADNARAPRVILWGDSNASHYVGMIASFARDAGFKFRNLAVGACPGIDGDPAPFVTAERLSDCRASLSIARPGLEDFDVVILSSSWTSYEGSRAGLMRRVMATAERLEQSGKTVILLGKVPTISGFDHRCQEKALSIPFLDCPNPQNPVASDIKAVNIGLRAFAARHDNIAYFDAAPYLCPKGNCAAFDRTGLQVYRDFSHLTMAASWRLGRRILEHQGLPLAFAFIKEPSRQLAEDR